MMEGIGSFVANPFGLGNAGYGFLDQLSDQLGLSNKSQVAQGMANIDQLMEEAKNVGAQNRKLYGDYLGQMQGIYGEGAGQYQDAVSRLSDVIGNGYDTFTYNGNVQDYYDKAANQRAQAAMRGIQNSVGDRWSSDFMNQLASKQQALASEEYSKAYDRMMQDRQQQLSEWQAGQNSKQGYISNLGTMANLYGNDRNQLANAYGDYYGNLASQNNADLQTRSDLMQSKGNLAMQENSGVGALLGGVGKVLGGIFGA